ncbi:hypothetical protein GGX14DRAFT_571846 [Mycena pura]|uniref:Zn(2)-C6 fungal-type domain-containing protein n=1 Tax=Mycena pura TaxID=153505 RepID=A0AAD6V2L1_9AGAR|nr:hypothetical protein GGX14DRAFT_571846 [Mycena pura]
MYSNSLFEVPKRVAVACSNCRERKIKCITESQDAPCMRCHFNGMPCEYVATERQRIRTACGSKHTAKKSAKSAGKKPFPPRRLLPTLSKALPSAPAVSGCDDAPSSSDCDATSSPSHYESDTISSAYDCGATSRAAAYDYDVCRCPSPPSPSTHVPIARAHLRSPPPPDPHSGSAYYTPADVYRTPSSSSYWHINSHPATSPRLPMATLGYSSDSGACSSLDTYNPLAHAAPSFLEECHLAYAGTGGGSYATYNPTPTPSRTPFVYYRGHIWDLTLTPRISRKRVHRCV